MFRDFVEAPVPFGLETTIDELRSVCKDAILARDLIDKCCQRESHRPKVVAKPENTEDDIPFDSVTERPIGNTREQGLRALRKHSPENHKKVMDGELSVHAACVKAGLRKPPPTPLEAAKKAVKKLGPKEIEEFRKWFEKEHPNVST